MNVYTQMHTFVYMYILCIAPSLGRFESNQILVNQIKFIWIKSNPFDSNKIHLNQIKFIWLKSNSFASNQIYLNQIKFIWIKSNLFEFIWITSNSFASHQIYLHHIKFIWITKIHLNHIKFIRITSNSYESHNLLWLTLIGLNARKVLENNDEYLEDDVKSIMHPNLSKTIRLKYHTLESSMIKSNGMEYDWMSFNLNES